MHIQLISTLILGTIQTNCSMQLFFESTSRNQLQYLLQAWPSYMTVIVQLILSYHNGHIKGSHSNTIITFAYHQVQDREFAWGCTKTSPVAILQKMLNYLTLACKIHYVFKIDVLTSNLHNTKILPIVNWKKKVASILWSFLSLSVGETGLVVILRRHFAIFV